MVHKAATQAELYEQRRAHHRGDESKRRKFLRWMQKTLGVSDDPQEDEFHMSQTATSHHNNHEQYDNNSNQMEPRKMSGSISSSHSSGFEYEPGVPVYYVGTNPQMSTPTDSFHNTMSTMASTASVSSATSVDASSIYDFHHRMPRQHQIPRDRFQRPNNQPRVLIIGGGIGGLCLAQGLKKCGIPFTVFERDPTPNYRTQGYRLRINGAGYEALKANLTRDNFEVFLRSTGHFLPGFSYIDAETGRGAPAGVKFAHRSSTTRHVFSTDRAMLRSLLLSDLAAGTEVQFGMAFKRYQILPNGRVEVQFENGTIAEGSLLVGADGTTSRVRRQYIPRNVTLLDTDTGAIYGKTPITPDIEQYFATGTTTMITCQHPKMALVIEPRCATKINLRDYITATGGMANPANTELEDLHNYLCWVLLARADVFHTREDMTVHDLYAMAPEEVADLSVQITSNWCPRIRALLEQQDPEWASFLRISTMSPDIKPWQPSMVTLLGDAGHTMTPAGIGCNTAMQDAMMLVQLFREVGVNVEAIARYEGAMRHNGRDGINASIDAGKRMYGLPDVEDMRVVSY